MRRYAIILICLFAALTATLAATVLAVDPYDVAGAPHIDGFNANKTRRDEDGNRVFVGHMVLSPPAGTLIFGNSRVVDGFSPYYTDWPGGLANAGMRGSNVFELARAAALAGRDPNLRCVIFALDMDEFSLTSKTKATYWISPLPDGSRTFALARMALSPHAFARAVQTAQDNLTSTRPPERWRLVYPRGEQARRFELTAIGGLDFFRSYTFDPQRLLFLQQTVDLLTQRGVQVIAFAPPVHAWRDEAMVQAGRFEEAYLIRRAISAMLAAYEKRPARAPCMPGLTTQFWDFGGFSAVSQSPAPGPEDVRAAPYYHETTHFTPRVGEAILARLQARPLAEPFTAEFGVLLRASDAPVAQAGASARRVRWLAGSASARRISAELAARMGEPASGGQELAQFILRDDWRALSREARGQGVRLTEIPAYHVQTAVVGAGLDATAP